jgi:hypothetical protein
MSDASATNSPMQSLRRRLFPREDASAGPVASGGGVASWVSGCPESVIVIRESIPVAGHAWVIRIG